MGVGHHSDCTDVCCRCRSLGAVDMGACGMDTMRSHNPYTYFTPVYHSCRVRETSKHISINSDTCVMDVESRHTAKEVVCMYTCWS